MARPACGRSFLPRADKRVSSPKHFRWAPLYLYHNLVLEFIQEGEIELPREIANTNFCASPTFSLQRDNDIDLFLVALLSLVCLVLTDSSSLVTRLTEECHRSDGERSLEWQTPAVAYPFGSLHDLCVAVVVVLPDEVVHHF